MKKIAVVTDTNTGFTPSDAKELGISLVATPFMIQGNTYFENIDLTHDKFYELLKDGEDIHTSQPSPADLIECWEGLLKEYDEIVHIPLSSGLSGAYQTANMLADDYDARVQVVNNQRISVTQKLSVLDAISLVEKGYDALQIKEILEEDKFNSSIYIMLDTLKYLKKGGRITPTAAALGTLLRIKPVLQIQGEKLDAFAKARTTGQGKSLMINAIRKDMEERFGGATPDNCEIMLAYSDDRDAILAFKKDVEEAFPGFTITHVDPLSMVVGCHIGEGAIACAVCKKLKK